MNQLFRAIVIDDEPAARRLMRNLLREHSDVVEVIDEAGNGKDAIEKIEKLKPELIFLDIQMPDLTGFEVIEQLHDKPNIIFTTAYEQYAIKAFENFSIDYLLKPIKEERLQQSIEKLKRFGRLNQTINLNGLQEIIKQSLTVLGDKLPSTFCRIHRSYIINKDKIKEMHKHFSGRYLFIMDDKSATRLTSGRTYQDIFRTEFGL